MRANLKAPWRIGAKLQGSGSRPALGSERPFTPRVLKLPRTPEGSKGLLDLLDLLERQKCDAKPQQGIDAQLGAIGTYWKKWGCAEPRQTLRLPAPSHPEAGRVGLPLKQKNEGNARRTFET